LLEMGFGIGELLECCDLQVPFVVGGDVRDEDGFASHIDPDFGLGLVGSVKDDLPRGLCDGMNDRLTIGPKAHNALEMFKPLLSG